MCVIQHRHTRSSRFNKVWGPFTEIPKLFILPIPSGETIFLCPEYIICYWLFFWTQILQNLKYFPMRMCWKHLMGLPGVLWCIGLLGETVAWTSSVILCLLYAKTGSYFKDRAKVPDVRIAKTPETDVHTLSLFKAINSKYELMLSSIAFSAHKMFVESNTVFKWWNTDFSAFGHVRRTLTYLGKVNVVPCIF